MKVILTILFFCLIMASSTCYAINCTVSTGSMHFPPYNFLSLGKVDSTTNISVFCDQSTPFAVKLSAGNSQGDFFQRRLISTETQTPLFYNLYLDSSHSQIWGEGTASTLFYQGTAGNVPINIPVFGRILPRQNVRPGQYQDSVVITVEW